MSNKWGWATIVALCFANTLVLAQQPGGGGRGGAGRGGRGLISLLANEAVQKELAVSEEQLGKLKPIGEAFANELREQLSAGGGGGGGFNAEAMAKIQEAVLKLTAKHLPAVKETLKPEQFTRLQQIAWQQAGAAAFSDADLAKKLAISQEQQDKIKGVMTDYAAKQAGLFAGGFNPDNFAKMRELNQERDGKASEVLSQDQRTKLTELLGKKFDMPQGGPGGGGRPARPNGEKK